MLQLINAYRFRGHQHARTDPLRRYDKEPIPELELAYHDLSEADFETVFKTGSLVGPDEATLEKVIQKNRAEMESNNYREYRRAAYPSIEDQLDAIHKARLGDDTHLQIIEQQIRKVKEKYPKGKKCDHSGCE